MKSNTHITIREYGYLLDGVGAGTQANAVGIPHSAFKNLLSNLHDDSQNDELHSFIKATSYHRKPALKVQNYVGVVRTACGTQIEILPKLNSNSENEALEEVTRTQLLKMLRTLRDSPFKQAGRAAIRDEKMPLLEVFISQFLSLVNQLIKRGVRSDYIAVTKNAKFLKGRLLISQQIRKNRVNPERFYIKYQEYQINRPANRLIKSTLLLISNLTRNPKNQRLAREFNFAFDEVPASSDVVSDFQKVKTDRTMNYYKEVLDWCSLLLKGNGPTSTAGSFNTLTLLYPMERIFEDYVAHGLRKNLIKYFPEAERLQTQARKHYLVNAHEGKPIFNLRPDYFVLNDKKPICVMDAKWKLLDSNARRKKYGISQADMYQLYAYGRKYLEQEDVKRLMLIYPKSDKFNKPLSPFEYEDGFVLEVVPFDIDAGELVL